MLPVVKRKKKAMHRVAMKKCRQLVPIAMLFKCYVIDRAKINTRSRLQKKDKTENSFNSFISLIQ